MIRILMLGLVLSCVACGSGAGSPAATGGSTGARAGTTSAGTSGETTGRSTSGSGTGGGTTSSGTTTGGLADGGPVCAQPSTGAAPPLSSTVTCTVLPVPDGGCGQRFACNSADGVAPELDEWLGFAYAATLPGDSDMTLSIQLLDELTPEYPATAPTVLTCSSLRNSCCPSPAALEVNGAFLVVTAVPTLGCAADGGPIPTLTAVSAEVQMPCGC